MSCRPLWSDSLTPSRVNFTHIFATTGTSSNSNPNFPQRYRPVSFPATAQSLFCAPTCFGHLVWPATKTQAAHHMRSMVTVYTPASYKSQLMYSMTKNHSNLNTSEVLKRKTQNNVKRLSPNTLQY